MSLTKAQKQILFKHLLFGLVEHGLLKRKDIRNRIKQEKVLFSAEERAALLEQVNKLRTGEEKVAGTWKPDKGKQKEYLEKLDKINAYTLDQGIALAGEMICGEFFKSIALMKEFSQIIFFSLLPMLKLGVTRPFDDMLRNKLIDINQRTFEGGTF